ncbi:DUF456 domain-containing protein [Gordonia soli]|uniref:DUF456 domain-containing protein n=1 Tax=Gordonia soli NBRC 108243 TaxID=1223545 RepID=M0QIM6_9ACTN|nr:DUF456 domain-containing protein [Gordonia soli]GAC68156.1 hypothetical protein GS4_11_04280 [Gordonia soli NBRC 108243]
MPFVGELVIGAVILLGLLGIVLPILPGTLLVVIAIGVWAFVVGGTAWAVFGVALGLIVIAEVIKYVVAGRRLRGDGVPNLTIVIGGLVGIVGFFVVPVIGLFLGFVLGAFVAELARTRDANRAWRGGISATKAVALTMLIELLAALVAASLWLGAAFVW